MLLSRFSLISRSTTRLATRPCLLSTRFTAILPSQLNIVSQRSFSASSIKHNSNNGGAPEPKKYDTSALDKLTRAEIAQLRNMHKEKENSFKDQTTINYALSVCIGFLGLSYAAVVLYRTLCSRTGFGGRPVTDKRKFTDDKLIPVDLDKRIRVSFTSEVSDILPWKFAPQQREVHVLPGETALAFYKARNTSDKDIIGMATYSITPGEASPYFNKIQCFCFEEQKLKAGEEVDMPVFFFIDPDFANDPRMRTIEDIILHYAFFKAHYQQDGELIPVDPNEVIEITDVQVGNVPL